MQIDVKYFRYLSFLQLDLQKEMTSKNFSACKNESTLAFTNRVFVPQGITAADAQQLKEFYGDRPFTLWIDRKNIGGIEDVKTLQYQHRITFPLMALDLQYLQNNKINPEIKMELITSKDLITTLWSDLVAKIYGVPAEELRKVVAYFVATEQFHKMHFYIGYLNHQAAATAIFIQRDDVVDIHWVGTLPEFRNQGLGRAITLYPLHELKKSVNTAILYASEMGKPMYEKMGFSVVGECEVHG